MRISEEQLDTLPKDFDWSFYITNHPDLMEFGLRTEEHAIAHYLLHGKNEGRLYKPLVESKICETINNNQFYDDLKYVQEIVLFTPWYNPSDSEVKKNNIKCLENNLLNKHIKYICLMLEHKNVEIPSHLRDHSKLIISNINKRVSYKDWFVLSEKHFQVYIKILANTDIYFDDTLEHIFSRHFNSKTFYAITRKDIDEDGRITRSYDSYQDYNRPTIPFYSQDCWIFQNRLPNINPDKTDFELGIGNCDRLFKNYLEKECDTNFINLEKKINAIHLDKRKTRSRKSYDLLGNMVDYKLFNITDYISPACIKPYSNKLESATLLLTGKEIETGDFDIFVQRLTDSITKSDRKYSKLLDFNISTQHQIPTNSIDILKKYFNRVNVIHLDIPEKYNTYKLDEPCPLYGKTAGPNYCFFETISKLKNYNTTLLLECDVFFERGWLSQVYNYCLYSGNFWVSGSKNYGYNTQSIHNVANEHINGGVALYATGNDNLQAWIGFCKQVLPSYVKHTMPDMPYDYLLYFTIHDFCNYDIQHYEIWRFIRNHYVNNKLIFNLSSFYEKYINPEEFKKHYPFYILHKKDDG